MAGPDVEVIRPLRRAEYDKLIALGEFAGERIELIEGVLLRMTPIGPTHHTTVARLMRLFVLAFEQRALVFCQGPIAANDLSEPEPDFAVVPFGNYEPEHISTAHFLVEVADASLSYDRGKKLRLYATSGIPEYWIVNIPERCVEVYAGPSLGAYAHVERYEHGQSIRPLAFPDLTFAVSDILAAPSE